MRNEHLRHRAEGVEDVQEGGTARETNCDRHQRSTASPAVHEPEANTSIPAHMLHGLALLLQAHLYAEELSRDVWDFAVEIPGLRAEGLTNSDFRWLVCKEYVEHAREITTPGENGRQFRPAGSLTFSKRTCFVLTTCGVAASEFGAEVLAAQQSILGSASPNGEASPDVLNSLPNSLRVVTNGQADISSLVIPKWDRDRHELRLEGELVKQFKLPSPNQETILMAFEEDKWPPRIDDPLPLEPGLEPKRRLHDTIKSLNRHQKSRLIRFMGDGTGEGIRWALCSES